ncbi:MAG: hypothetical protein OEM01_13005 [Desulfobulbaceae bacterium]|nr:hypothetical protein [Desulfobulbaceae bacterium]
MATTQPTEKRGKSFIYAIAGVGAAFGVWALVAFTSLLAQMDWSLTEVLRQYMIATGALAEKETLVDYYTHIKGIEYIIAVAFLGLYPAYYKYVNRTKATIKA